MRPWTRGKKTAKNPWPLHCQLLLPLVEEKTEDGVSAAGCGGAPCADVVLQQGEVRHQCVVEEAGRGANGGGATLLQRRRWPSGPWALLLLVPLGLLQEVEQAALLQELVAADVRCGAVQTNGVETHVGVPTFRADDPLNQGCDYLSLSVAKRASSVLFSANRLVS